MDEIFQYMNDGSGEVDLSSKKEAQFKRSMVYCIISSLIFILAIVFRQPAIAMNFPGGEIGIIIANFMIILTVLILCVGQRIPCSSMRKKPAPTPKA